MDLVTIGAYDRFNLGDLLFPHVLDRAVATVAGEAGVRHLAISAADMRPAGGHAVEALRDWLAAPAPPDGAGVIMGGGEVIGASWSSMLVSLDSPLGHAARRMSGLPRPLRERMAAGRARAPWPYPFVPEPSRFRAIGYSSVGASHSAALPKKEQAMRWRNIAGARYVSVRDRTSLELARAQGVCARLAPDSVAALFGIPRFAALRAGTSHLAGRRVVVQASDTWVAAHGKALAPELVELHAAGVDLVLLPVGLAHGHRDDGGLARLATLVRADLAVTPVTTVADAVTAICRADVVVASSLHANVIAMAAGKPHVGLAGVPKLAAYLSTWAFPASARPACPEDVGRLVQQLLARPESDARESLAIRLAALATADTAGVVEAVLRDG